MVSTIIALMLIGLSLITLVVIVVRKIPFLRVLNISSDPEVKVKELKHHLVAQRLGRMGNRYGGLFKKIVSPLSRSAVFIVQSVVKKLTLLEEHYQHMRRQSSSHALGKEAVKKLLQEAESMIKEERYGEAEKKLIEVLSHDAKNTSAYEDLGMLYIAMKQFDQAEETFKFLIKIHPDDPSVLTSLGEIALEREETTQAREYFEKAMKKRPNNPKYIDFFIEACLQAKDVAGAERGIKQLRKVNPENQKIEEFAERIEAVRKSLPGAAGQEKEETIN